MNKYARLGSLLLAATSFTLGLSYWLHPPIGSSVDAVLGGPVFGIAFIVLALAICGAQASRRGTLVRLAHAMGCGVHIMYGMSTLAAAITHNLQFAGVAYSACLAGCHLILIITTPRRPSSS